MLSPRKKAIAHDDGELHAIKQKDTATRRGMMEDVGCTIQKLKHNSTPDEGKKYEWDTHQVDFAKWEETATRKQFSRDHSLILQGLKEPF